MIRQGYPYYIFSVADFRPTEVISAVMGCSTRMARTGIWDKHFPVGHGICDGHLEQSFAVDATFLKNGEGNRLHRLHLMLTANDQETMLYVDEDAFAWLLKADEKYAVNMYTPVGYMQVTPYWPGDTHKYFTGFEREDSKGFNYYVATTKPVSGARKRA